MLFALTSCFIALRTELSIQAGAAATCFFLLIVGGRGGDLRGQPGSNSHLFSPRDCHYTRGFGRELWSIEKCAVLVRSYAAGVEALA